MVSRGAPLAALVVAGVLAAACSPPGQVGRDVVAGTTVETTAPTMDAPNGTARVPPPDTAPDGTIGSSPALPPAEVDWHACDTPLVIDPALQCARMPVPLDYDDPSGAQISIAIVRVPATADERVGAILFNPGGPGASGFDYIARSGTSLATLMGLQQFDLIGFDPRGVGRSNGLRCLSDRDLDAASYLDETPESPTEQAVIDATRQQFATACVEKYGDTLRHYSTDNTARDMDAIRAAMGDDQISYLGVSYGTYLGATYATLFPDRVRAMVLDAAYEPTGDTVEQQYSTSVVGFEQAFQHWASWCQVEEQCAFRSADVPADWDALAARLDASPVVQENGRPANQTVMEVATIAAMYSETTWPRLADALAAVRDAADPTQLFAIADAYIGRAPDGSYSATTESNRIITCASGIAPAQPADPAALAATLHSLAPHFARNVDVADFVDGCAALMPATTPRTLQYSGDAAIVVVGGTNDPATPLRWAEEMDALMGGTSALVTYTGEGHGALETSLCATAIEAAALVSLTVPNDGTVCEPDPLIERPSWWDDLPVPAGVSAAFDDAEVSSALGIGPTVAYTELRTSTLSPTATIDAYDNALAAASFDVSDRREPFDGVTQGVYFSPTGDAFSAIAIDPASFEALALHGLTDLLPPGETLIVLLAPRA